VLKTARGAADYFPEGIVFRPHPTNNVRNYALKLDKRKAKAVGMALPPLRVFST
jgi:hypothetical protein